MSGVETVPWWKNRRRWFYGALIAIIAAIPLGGWIWYHHDFRLPLWLSLRNPNQIHRIQKKLVRWKISMNTRDLRLAGTTWEDSLTGGVAEFGADGIFSWKTLPSQKRNIWGVHDDPTHAAVIDGAVFRFKPADGLLFWSNYGSSMTFEEANLEFPGKNWTGHIGYNGKLLVLSVQIHSDDGSDNRDFLMTFDRKVSP